MIVYRYPFSVATTKAITSRERLRAVCRGELVDRPPVWIMRQAGRTLPEYNALRAKYSFWELVRTPELASEVTAQPVRRFPLDAAIVFSDILTVPVAMGLDITFDPSPKVGNPVRTAADIQQLRLPEVDAELGYVAEALQSSRALIGNDLALIGFAGAPYTIASYMVEGGGSKSYTKIKALMYGQPQLYHDLMTRISTVTAAYLQMQLRAGADCVQLFDSWAGELSPSDYGQYALPYVKQVVSAVQKEGPIIYYVNGIGNFLELAASSGADVLGIDWRVELGQVRSRVGDDVVLQGNLDPAALFAPAELIRGKVNGILKQTTGIRHILNLGHGLAPDTPLSGIEAFIEAAVSGGQK